jgi:hypothetical protein
MKSQNILLYSLIAFLFLLTFGLYTKVQSLESEIHELKKPELYVIMNQMLEQVHKLSYSVGYENSELADFYIHELEEAIEDIIDADVEYGGQPVGQLTQTMLLPALELLEDALDARDWMQVREKLGVLVQSCNNCHAATGYSSIVVLEKAEVNPFNQKFRQVN